MNWWLRFSERRLRLVATASLYGLWLALVPGLVFLQLQVTHALEAERPTNTAPGKTSFQQTADLNRQVAAPIAPAGDVPAAAATVVGAGFTHTCAIRNDDTLACWGNSQWLQTMGPTGTFTEVGGGWSHGCGLRTDGTIVCWGYPTENQLAAPAGTFTELAVGYEHNCAIRTDGTVACWGRNNYGQMNVPSGYTFVQLSAGSDNTCGLTPDGEVVCWGADWLGQTDVPAGTYSQVSSGTYHSCGLQTDGAITCWGDQTYFVNLPSGTFTQISAGSYHNCAVRTDGSIACWGADTNGSVQAAVAGSFREVSAGGVHSCGLRTDGQITCWGYSGEGQTTVPPGLYGPTGTIVITQQTRPTSDTKAFSLQTPSSISPTVELRHGESVTLELGAGEHTLTQAAAAGYSLDDVTCDQPGAADPANRRAIITLTQGETVHCTFTNSLDRGTVIIRQVTDPAGLPVEFTFTSSSTVTPTFALGDGETETFYMVPGSLTVTQNLISGYDLRNISCSPNATTDVDSRQATINVTKNTTVTCTFTGARLPLVPFETLATTGLTNRNCAIRFDGTIACVGYKHSATFTNPPSGIFRQISTGYSNICGLRPNGTVECAGSDMFGQNTVPSGTYRQVSISNYHACAVRADGEVVCWGTNELGVRNAPAGRFLMVSVGAQHSCGLRTDGAIVCWGSPNDNRTNAPSGNDFTDLDAGVDHTCAIRQDGTAVCWGKNSNGQLDVPEGTTYRQISGGFDHTCGLLTDGSVRCWGNNAYGKATAPAGSYIEVDAGNDTSCAIRTNGTTRCWGDNTYLQQNFPTGSYGPTGWIEVIQSTESALTTAFSYSLSPATVSAFSLSHGASQKVQVPIGTHTLVQTPLGGFELADISCDSEGVVADVDNTTAMITVSRDETITCTFASISSMANSGRIFIRKETDTEGQIGQFSFTATPTLTPTFELGNGHEQEFLLRTGVYTITETASATDFSLADISCEGGSVQTDLGAGQARITLTADATITCIFAGTRDTGTVEIRAETSPAGLGGIFDFTTTSTVTPTFSLGDGQTDTLVIPTGSLVVTQRTEGFFLSAISCGPGATTDLANRRATITLAKDATVTCTFTIEQIPAPPIETLGSTRYAWGANCAIRFDGTAVCGAPSTLSIPAGPYTQISGGWSHVCGLRKNGTAACWAAENDYNSGQLSVPANTTFRQITAGGRHSCGVKTDGTGVCWGDSTYDKLTVPAGEYIQIEAGFNHNCGLRTDRTITCWGYDGYSLTTAPSGNSFVRLSSGDYHTCALRENGSVTCWGNTTDGRTSVPSGTYINIDAGWNHTCGIKTDGTAVCWGNNTYGKTTAPTGSFSEISTGRVSSCGLMTDGSVTCWGDTLTRDGLDIPAGSYGPNGFIEISQLTENELATEFRYTMTPAAAADFTLAHGQTQSIQASLKTYTVTQSAPSGFTVTDINCSGGTALTDPDNSQAVITIARDATTSCVFTTVRDTGTVVINQLTNPAGQDGTFSFTSSSAADLTFSLRHGEAYTLTVPTGQLTVTQSAAAGYSLTSLSCDQPGADYLEDAKAMVEVTRDTVVTCTFTSSLDTGTIVVRQETGPGSSEPSFSFSSSSVVSPAFSLSNGEAYTLTLPTGTVTVTQDAAAGYTLTGLSCDQPGAADLANGKATVEVARDTVVTCTFTSTRDTGTAVIRQETDPTGRATTFSFISSSADHAGFSLSHGEAHTLTLPTGIVTVTQSAAAGASLTGLTCDQPGAADSANNRVVIDVTKDALVICTFTNTRDTGTVVINKATDPAGLSDPFSFTTSSEADPTFSLRHGESYTLTVPTGPLTITQSAAADFTLTGLSCDQPGAADMANSRAVVDVFKDAIVTCTFTDTRETGNVILRMQSNLANDETSFSFSSSLSLSPTLSLQAGETITLTAPTGTVTVTQDAAAGYSLTSLSCDQPGAADLANRQATITLAKDAAVTCTFTSTRDTGTVVIREQADPTANLPAFSFSSSSADHATFSLDHGESYTMTLPTGELTISQATAEGAYLSTLSCDPAATTDLINRRAVVTVTKDDTTVCTYTNAELPPVPGEYFSSGGYHNCAIRLDGTLQCWGSNYVNELNAPGGTYTQISAGGGHSCALSTGGSVVCWQFNFYGQSSAPGGTFTQVSAGSNHSCGVRTNGSVTCWGNSAHGQLNVPAGTYRQVSGGGLHSCAIRTDGTSVCWGENSLGQSNAPAGTFRQVSAGRNHTCGVRTDGSLACWGHNGYGQINAPGGTYTQVSSGDDQTCAITPSGSIICWGRTDFGMLNAPSGSFTAATTGLNYSCGLRADGAAICWGGGSNDGGWADSKTGPFGPGGEIKIIQLTSPSTLTNTFSYTSTASTAPAFSLTHGLTQTIQVPVGTYTITQDAAAGFSLTGLTCTGDGTGDLANRRAAVTVTNGATVTCTFTNTRDTGTVVVRKATSPAGLTDSFNFTSTSTITPTFSLRDGEELVLTLPTGPLTVTQGAAAGFTLTDLSCDQPGAADLANSRAVVTITKDATVTCSFTNTRDSGNVIIAKAIDPAGSTGVFNFTSTSTVSPTFNLGEGQSVTLTVPTGAFTVTESAAAGFALTDIECLGTTVQSDIDARWTSMTVAKDAVITCTFTSTELPPPPSEIISANGSHTCALRPDGTISCWGNSLFDQTDAPPGTYSQVSVGGGHACALKTDNTLTCWGHGAYDYGQTNAPSGAFRQVSAGSNHTCALRPDGTITCWGNNDWGQASPPAGSYSQVSSGSLLTCALTVSGTVVCWGMEQVGSLPVLPPGSYTQISAGYHHVCGLRADSTIACEGGSNGQSSVPNGSYVQVSAGGAFSCGLGLDGSIACWGDNSAGQTNAPSGTYSQISSGDIHSCALRPDGSAACWGRSDYGQSDDQDGPFGPAGRIEIAQIIEPSTLTNSFQFTSTSTVTPTFSLGHGMTETLHIGVGTYVVAQAAAAGFTLSDISCSSGGTDDGTTATITVTPDATVTCTFTNTQDTGTVIINKVTSPAGLTDTFSFSSTATLTPTFSLSHGESYTLTAPAGPFTVIQSAAAGFTLTDLSCDQPGAADLANRRAVVDVAKDQTVTCTFTDTRDTGNLRVTNVLSPTGLTDSFTFTVTNDASVTEILGVAGGSTGTLSLPTGTYRITAAVSTGFVFRESTCPGVVSPSASTEVAVTILKDQTVTCTFTNEIIPGPSGVDPVTEAGAPNGGDGNGDGVPDYVQDNVTSLPSAADNTYVTIAAPPGTQMSNVIAAAPPPSAELPPGVQLPLGVFGFTLNDLTPGATVTVTLHLEAPVATDAYFKLQNDKWTAFPFAEFVDSQTVVLTLTDGGAGDQDGRRDGIIVDPGAPGVRSAQAGVFVSTWRAGVTSNSTGGLAYGPHDILLWDGAVWTKWFDGTAAGLSPTTRWKHNINAFYIPNPVGSEVYMSLTQSQQRVGTLGWVDGYDIIRWNGTAFSRWFEGERVGLNVKTQEKIDGLHVLAAAPSWSEFHNQSCVAYLLISTQGVGIVPKPGAKNNVLKFSGEDVLGFCAGTLGTTTAGRWEMVLDGSSHGIRKNNLDSIAMSGDATVLHLTTNQAIDIPGAFGGHSMVFAYEMATRRFYGPLFSAPNRGINQKLDGLHLVDDWR